MTFDSGLQLVAVLGAIVSFVWGVYQWKYQAGRDLDQRNLEAKRIADTRKIEAKRPFLDRQLTLYNEATQVVAKIATLEPSEQKEKALKRFWELYWGELALVEDINVESAMKAFGDAVRKGVPPEALKNKSLNLAHACRLSLDKSWEINAWSRRN